MIGSTPFDLDFKSSLEEIKEAAEKLSLTETSKYSRNHFLFMQNVIYESFKLFQTLDDSGLTAKYGVETLAEMIVDEILRLP